MSLEELQFQVDQLTFQLDEQNQRHAEAVARLTEEAKQLRKSLHACLERGRAKASDDAPAPPDDAFIRQVQWKIENFSSRIRETPRNEAIWSVEFAVLGVQGLQLEFFPQGRESTKLPGFCALFLWCPAGVKIKYRLRVGNHWSAPDEDEYESKMGHGHSSFCDLEAQRDEKTDSIIVGLEIMSLYYQQDAAAGVRLMNAGPEAAVDREADIVRNSHMDCVQWRIRNILKRTKEAPRGTAICSPTFSIAGVREMLLEFYPNGIQPLPGAKEGREGYCGFYVRADGGKHRAASGPLTLQLTLFVGGSKKGPIRTDFDGNAAKGLPEFCRLEDQIAEGEEDLIVGVQITNPALFREDTELLL